MNAKKVDYDQLAPTYDRRFQNNAVRDAAAALSALVRDLGATRILEVGCGTGRWLSDLKATAGQLFGLDLSSGMLERARSRDGELCLVRGRAGRLPYQDSSFDLVYCVNAIHHFDEQKDFVLEARRLLRPKGALAVVGMDPHGRRDNWYVYRYFPGTFETDLARFPSWGTVLDWMTAAGFGWVSWRVVERIHDPKAGQAVLEDPFLQKGATSQLALLSRAEYAAGLRRIQEAIQAGENAGEQLVFASDILLGMHVARVESQAWYERVLPEADGSGFCGGREEAGGLQPAI